MTNSDKSTLRKMIREGKTDSEILRYVDCTKATIRKYRKALLNNASVKETSK